jgi:hypothetical protein
MTKLFKFAFGKEVYIGKSLILTIMIVLSASQISNGYEIDFGIQYQYLPNEHRIDIGNLIWRTNRLISLGIAGLELGINKSKYPLTITVRSSDGITIIDVPATYDRKPSFRILPIYLGMSPVIIRDDDRSFLSFDIGAIFSPINITSPKRLSLTDPIYGFKEPLMGWDGTGMVDYWHTTNLCGALIAKMNVQPLRMIYGAIIFGYFLDYYSIQYDWGNLYHSGFSTSSYSASAKQKSWSGSFSISFSISLYATALESSFDMVSLGRIQRKERNLIAQSQPIYSATVLPAQRILEPKSVSLAEGIKKSGEVRIKVAVMNNWHSSASFGDTLAEWVKEQLLIAGYKVSENTNAPMLELNYTSTMMYMGTPEERIDTLPGGHTITHVRTQNARTVEKYRLELMLTGDNYIADKLLLGEVAVPGFDYPQWIDIEPYLTKQFIDQISDTLQAEFTSSPDRKLNGGATEPKIAGVTTPVNSIIVSYDDLKQTTYADAFVEVMLRGGTIFCGKLIFIDSTTLKIEAKEGRIPINKGAIEQITIPDKYKKENIVSEGLATGPNSIHGTGTSTQVKAAVHVVFSSYPSIIAQIDSMIDKAGGDSVRVNIEPGIVDGKKRLDVSITGYNSKSPERQFDSQGAKRVELGGDFCSRLKAALHSGSNTISSGDDGVTVNGVYIGSGWCCGTMENVESDFAIRNFGCK